MPDSEAHLKLRTMNFLFRAVVDGVYNHPLLLIFLFSLTYWFLLARFTSPTGKLKHIPTLGYDSVFLSYIDAIKFIINSRKVLEESFRKWPRGMFKYPQLTEWVVVVSEPQAIDEVRKAPENVLSANIAINETLQVEHTLGKNIASNLYHVPIIRAQLTRALPVLVPDVIDEIQCAFRDSIPATEDWTKIKVLETTMGIVGRASNRIFVGLPLCRDPEYIKLNIRFTLDVVKTGTLLHLVPEILRPFMLFFMPAVSRSIKQGLQFLGPVIQERRLEREMSSDGKSEKVDLLTWLMDDAEGEERTDWGLTSRILTVNFAAIHTSSMAFTHALYYMATYPEFMAPIREEIQEVINEHGWSKEGLDSMVKLDSFLKETQRLSPLGNVVMNRIALVDYTFADGTFVPKGTNVVISIDRAHMNPDIYPEPEKFDPFRYVKMKAAVASDDSKGPMPSFLSPEKKFDMVSTGLNSLGFGHGRHACPGRYFATSELKLMLAHVAMNYDVRMENEGVRPKDLWIATSCSPNPTAEVLFRKRRV